MVRWRQGYMAIRQCLLTRLQTLEPMLVLLSSPSFSFLPRSKKSDIFWDLYGLQTIQLLIPLFELKVDVVTTDKHFPSGICVYELSWEWLKEVRTEILSVKSALKQDTTQNSRVNRPSSGSMLNVNDIYKLSWIAQHLKIFLWLMSSQAPLIVILGFTRFTTQIMSLKEALLPCLLVGQAPPFGNIDVSDPSVTEYLKCLCNFSFVWRTRVSLRILKMLTREYHNIRI